MKFANHHGGLSKESNSFMAGTRWKSLFGIPEYLAKIHLEKAKREKNHFKALSAANPQGMEKYFVLRCSLTCCRSAFFHLAAVCLRASVVQLLLVLQHDSCSSFFVDDDWLYWPIDPAFMLPRESHARGGFNTNLIGVRLQPSSTTNLIGQLF